MPWTWITLVDRVIIGLGGKVGWKVLFKPPGISRWGLDGTLFFSSGLQFNFPEIIKREEFPFEFSRDFSLYDISLAY